MSRVQRLIGTMTPVALLAAGLLLVSGPVGGQADERSVPVEIVRITSAAVAGTYVVGWETLGGCDPGGGTSGFAGETIMTVTAHRQPDATPTPGELTGTPAVAVVLTRPFCRYVWSVSFVEATTGAACMVGPNPFKPDADNEIRITLADPDRACAQTGEIVVRLVPALPVATDAVDHNAILRARFSATARAVERAPKGCGTHTADSEIEDNDTTGDDTDDTVSIELEVVATTSAGEACRYDVAVSVPGQLDLPDYERRDVVFEDVPPGSEDEPTERRVRLSVATTKIYLIQNVVGDSGGAAARYEMTRTCEKPDLTLPPALEPRPARGMQRIDPVSTVALREGRYNITAALAEDPTDPDAFDGHLLRVLDANGEPCEATVTISDLPDRCRAAATSRSLTLVNAPQPAILEFRITCDADAGE